MRRYLHPKTAVQIVHPPDLSRLSDASFVGICSARQQCKLTIHTYIIPRIPVLYTLTHTLCQEYPLLYTLTHTLYQGYSLLYTLTHTLYQGYSLLYTLTHTLCQGYPYYIHSHIHYIKDTPYYIHSHIHYTKDTPSYTCHNLFFYFFLFLYKTPKFTSFFIWH